MTATTATPTPSLDAAPSRRGWPALPCPRCGEAGSVSLDLADLHSCRFGANDCEFTLTDVAELVAAWGEVIRWVESAPATPTTGRRTGA